MSKPIQLMQPTPEARQWRDLDATRQNQELAVKIALVVGIVLLLTVMAISIYFCATTTHTFTNRLGQVITASNAPFIAFPAVFGTLGVVSMGLAFFMVNFERMRNGFEENLDNSAIITDRHLLLTTGTLKEVHGQYYKKNGGIGPLVRKGFLEVEQGERLRKILRAFDTNQATIQAFESRSPSFVKEIKANPEEYTKYNDAQQHIGGLERHWNRLKQEISKNF